MVFTGNNGKSAKQRLFEIIESMSEESRIALLGKLTGKTARRRYPRKTCTITIHYATLDQVFTSYIHDISTGGIYIETKEELRPGERLRMSFRFPDYAKPLMVEGEVARKDDKGIGVKFVNLDPNQINIINSLVEMMDNKDNEDE